MDQPGGDLRPLTLELVEYAHVSVEVPEPRREPGQVLDLAVELVE